MDKPPVVSLGAKDKSQASLGQRVRTHFAKHWPIYVDVGSALGSTALAGYGGYLLANSHNRRLAIPTQRSLERRPRDDSPQRGVYHGLAPRGIHDPRPTRVNQLAPGAPQAGARTF